MVTTAFDVVIVGGGAAGCVVAARLAESSPRSILLLEAGPDRRANPPAGFHDGWGLPADFDWGFASEPDARGVVRSLRRVKLLGGTSWLTRFAFRGSPADYDDWAALGNPGWGFDDVLPYFVRLEADADFGDQPWHGERGPIPITRYRDLELSEVAAGGLQALEAAGFPIVEDHNRPGAVGAGRMPMSSRGGARVTTADAYLPVTSMPTNLTVRGDAQVADVIFDGSHATGVRLLDGSIIDAGWVVLTAGTYGSPTILMRSGVGPAEHLRSVGIPVRIDLAGVGANLADHPGIDIDCGYGGPARPKPLLHIVATFRSTTASSTDAPDLMLWLSDPPVDGDNDPIFEVDVLLLKPRSRGTVRLRSADPSQPPSVELPNLRDPLDVDRLAEGFRRGLDVAMRPEIRRLCRTAPSPDANGFQELRAAVRTHGRSYPHVTGTCSMGPRPDDGAVVDPLGDVHGAERLSVVDASIIPIAHSAFTHLPVIMLAERLAEHIASVA